MNLHHPFSSAVNNMMRVIEAEMENLQYVGYVHGRVKKCMDLEVDGNRRRGRPRKRWRDVVMRDMEDCALVRKDAFDRAEWRMLLWGNQLTPA